MQKRHQYTLVPLSTYHDHAVVLVRRDKTNLLRGRHDAFRRNRRLTDHVFAFKFILRPTFEEKGIMLKTSIVEVNMRST